MAAGHFAVVPEPGSAARSLIVWLDADRLRQQLLEPLVAKYFGDPATRPSISCPSCSATSRRAVVYASAPARSSTSGAPMCPAGLFDLRIERDDAHDRASSRTHAGRASPTATDRVADHHRAPVGRSRRRRARADDRRRQPGRLAAARALPRAARWRRSSRSSRRRNMAISARRARAAGRGVRAGDGGGAASAAAGAAADGVRRRRCRTSCARRSRSSVRRARTSPTAWSPTRAGQDATDR